jgi:hypothetical protein
MSVGCTWSALEKLAELPAAAVPSIAGVALDADGIDGAPVSDVYGYPLPICDALRLTGSLPAAACVEACADGTNVDGQVDGAPVIVA